MLVFDLTPETLYFSCCRLLVLVTEVLGFFTLSNGRTRKGDLDMKTGLILGLLGFILWAGCKPSDPADEVVPGVNVLYPADGQRVSGTVNVVVSASDNKGLEQVDLYLDNRNVVAWSKDPYSYEWNTSEYLEGSVVIISAVAQDQNGNMSVARASVVISANKEGDVLPPSATIVFPTDARQVSNHFLVIGDVRDDSGIDEVQLWVNDEIEMTLRQYPFHFDLDWSTRTDRPEGLYSMFLKAVDNHQNIAYSSVITVTKGAYVPPGPDVTAPEVNILYPLPTTGQSSDFHVLFDALDKSTIVRVQCYVDGDLVKTITNSDYKFPVDISGFPSGSQHSIYIKAYDKFLNIGTAYLVFTVQ
jgi:hypothetical protein